MNTYRRRDTMPIAAQLATAIKCRQDGGLLSWQDSTLQQDARIQRHVRRVHTGQVLRRLHGGRGLADRPRLSTWPELIFIS